jgi:hypothetical protein
VGDLSWSVGAVPMVADVDAAQAIATRRRLRGACADRPVLVIGTPYAPPCAGHVVSGSRGFEFRTKR